MSEGRDDGVVRMPGTDSYLLNKIFKQRFWVAAYPSRSEWRQLVFLFLALTVAEAALEEIAGEFLASEPEGDREAEHDRAEHRREGD